MLHCWPMYKAEKAQGARFAGPLSMKCESRGDAVPAKVGSGGSSSALFTKAAHLLPPPKAAPCGNHLSVFRGSSERKFNFLLFLFKKKNLIHNCNTWVS